MSLNMNSYFINMCKRDPKLFSSLGIRYPTGIMNAGTSCHLCLIDGCEGNIAVYEQFKCRGEKCVSTLNGSGEGAITWLCEKCALEMDIRQMIATKKKLVNVKRNMVCNCLWGSDARVTTYCVKNTAKGEARSELTRSEQYGVLFDGVKMFAKKPSMEQIVANPDVLVQHYLDCRKMTKEGEVETALTFNSTIADIHNSEESKRISVQFVWDEDKQVLNVISSAQVSTVKITPVSTAVSKGGVTRSVNPKRQCTNGTSSKFAGINPTDQPTGNIIEMGMVFEDVEGTGASVELVCDGVLPPGSAQGLMKHLSDVQTQSTVPSFCPVANICEIKTSVNATSPEDATKREIFYDIVRRHNVEYKTVDGFFVVLNTDTGEGRIFKGIAESLMICGFGARADHFDWHVVVLRRGRHFLTLYILVVHAPYPGLWIISERLTVGPTVEECTTMSIMVGQDVAPYTYVSNSQFHLERGLWTPETMSMYMGFAEKSYALERCFNDDVDSSGNLIKSLCQCDLLTMSGVKAGFMREKDITTMMMAEVDDALNNQYIAKITVEHEERQIKMDEPMSQLFPGTIISAGEYGMFRVVLRKHGDSDEDEGELVSNGKVVIPAGSVPEMRCSVTKEIGVFIELHHFCGSHPDPVKRLTRLHALYVDQNEDEMYLEDLTYNQLSWEHKIGTEMCIFNDEETHCFVIVRNPDTNKVLFRIRFDHRTD